MKAHRHHDDGLRVRQAIDDAVVWRRQSLRKAGFTADLANRVAGDWNIDVHAVLELVDRGCPPALAVTIMEPLPCEMRP